MLLKMMENGIFDTRLFDEDGGEAGNGADDGSNKENKNTGESDTGDQGGGKMIDMKDLTGDDKENNNDNSDDKKDGDDKEEKAERPENIPEKFWDVEKGEPRTEAMAKAYSDLEKKLGSKAKAPSEYKIELNDDAKKIFNADAVDDDPMLNWFKDYAKENNFTQEMFNGALEGFAKSSGDMMKENSQASIDPAEEREKLGKNADGIIKNQIDFLSTMFKQGSLDEGMMQEVLILTETASGMKALQAIRSHYGENQNIPMNLSAGAGVKTSDELRHMQADKKYGSDGEYTAMVDKEYEKKYGGGNSGSSMRSSL